MRLARRIRPLRWNKTIRANNKKKRELPREPQDQGMENSDGSPLSNSVKPLAKTYQSFHSLTLVGFPKITTRSFLRDKMYI